MYLSTPSSTQSANRAANFRSARYADPAMMASNRGKSVSGDATNKIGDIGYTDTESQTAWPQSRNRGLDDRPLGQDRNAGPGRHGKGPGKGYGGVM